MQQPKKESVGVGANNYCTPNYKERKQTKLTIVYVEIIVRIKGRLQNVNLTENESVDLIETITF